MTGLKAIDLFAGAGGFSTGARMAGVEVVWAANHWPEAVKWHAENHPGADHICQDLHQADWSQVPDHDIMTASPCCQGHSRARGKNSKAHDASRSTAWAVVSAAEYHRPSVVLVENVPEFLKWKLYPAWGMAMQALGYSLTPYVLDAADHGVPQHRVRLFIVCSRSKAPTLLSLPKREHAPASDLVQWGSGRWAPVMKPGRSEKTIARFESGRAQFGDRFLMSYYGNSHGGRSIQRPVGTITTRDRWAAVDGDMMRMFSPDECRAAMGFPDDYALPENKRLAVHLLGNAVCPPVARDVIQAVMAA